MTSHLSLGRLEGAVLDSFTEQFQESKGQSIFLTTTQQGQLSGHGVKDSQSAVTEQGL